MRKTKKFYEPGFTFLPGQRRKPPKEGIPPKGKRFLYGEEMYSLSYFAKILLGEADEKDAPEIGLHKREMIFYPRGKKLFYFRNLKKYEILRLRIPIKVEYIMKNVPIESFSYIRVEEEMPDAWLMIASASIEGNKVEYKFTLISDESGGYTLTSWDMPTKLGKQEFESTRISIRSI